MIYAGLAEPFGGADPSAYIRSGRHEEVWRLWLPVLGIIDVAVTSGAVRAVEMAVARVPYSLPRIVDPVNGKQRERDHRYLAVAVFGFPFGFWSSAHHPSASLLSCVVSGAALALIMCAAVLALRRFAGWRRAR